MYKSCRSSRKVLKNLVNHLNLEMTQPRARARAPEPELEPRARARLPPPLMDFLMYFLLPPNPEHRTQSPSPSAALSNGFPNVFPTAPEREIEPELEPVCRPVCRFFLAQILTLRAHFHRILTLFSAFELQNLGFAQILTLLAFLEALRAHFHEIHRNPYLTRFFWISKYRF